ncbi:MAG: DUF2125 domain-containing protein [Pseudomonadota bacterium]
MRISIAAVPILTAALGVPVQAAWADVTARDVWATWQSMAQGYEQTIDVENETYSGGILTLSGITTTMTVPDGILEGRLSELVLSEQGDGTVVLSMPETYPFSFSAEGVDGEEITLSMRFEHQGLSLVASGEPGAIEYDFSAANMAVVLDELQESDVTADMAVSALLTDVSGTYSVLEGTPQTIVSQFLASNMTLDIAFSEDTSDASSRMSVSLSDLDSRSTGSISPFSGGRDLAGLLRAGLSSSGAMTTSGSEFSLSMNDETDESFSMSGTSGASILEVDLGDDGIRYSGTSSDVAAEFEAATLSMPPVALQIAETGGEVQMPLLATEDDKDFGIKLDFSDLTASDGLWGMIDPSGALPRDPANLQLDISGVGKWAIDISDPEAIADPSTIGGLPGEVSTLTLNGLLLSILGAELTGTGDFSFNNEGFQPLPSGTVNLSLTGGNSAIDTLVSAGLVPEDQAMGARMMLGLFARPGEGDDELVTTIEVQEDGSVLANGQRIR